MAIIGIISALFKADTTPWAKGCQTAKSEISGVGKHSEGVLSQMKESFGKHSIFGQMGHLMAGKGAIGGLTLFAMEARKAAEEIKKAADEYGSLEITAQDWTREVAGAIPIFGGIAQGMMTVTTLWDHSNDAVKQYIQHTKDLNAQSERRVAREKELHQIIAAYTPLYANARHQTERLNAGTPADEKQTELISGHAEALTAIRKPLEEFDQMHGEHLRKLREHQKELDDVGRMASLTANTLADQAQSYGWATPFEYATYKDAMAQVDKYKEETAKNQKEMAEMEKEYGRNRQAVLENQNLAKLAENERFAAAQKRILTDASKAVETPAEKYLEEVKNVQALVKQGLGQRDAQRMLAKAQEALNHTDAYQKPISEVRRHQFGFLETPKIATGFEKLVKVQEDQAQLTQETNTAIAESNRLLQAMQDSWTPASGL